MRDRISAREFERPDLEACLAVFDTNVPTYFTMRERAEFRSFLEALPGPYLVLTDREGEVVGCGGYAFSDENGTADLCWGMVRQELHGTGLGRRLTELRIERSRQDPRVTAIALHTSHYTAGFYERLGFEVLRVIEDAYAPGLHRYDMRLDLRMDEDREKSAGSEG